METIIPVVATLLGGLLGFLASTITNRQNNKFQRENENILFQRQKKEDLYYVVAKLKHEYRGHMSNCLLKVLNGTDFKFNNTKDITLWDELSMIVCLYFPDIKDSVSNLIEEKDKVGEVIGESITFNNASKKQVQDLNSKIFVSFEIIEKKFDKFHDAIAAINE